MQKLITLGLLFSLLMLGSLSGPTTAESYGQSRKIVPAPTELQYAAKFICGRMGDAGLAAPGQYFTIINVHNPSPNALVKFRKKFALGEREERAGKIYGFFPASLRADEVMGIDCPNIYNHTGIPPGTFIEGYAVIHTRSELDIESVFTAGRDHVETIHTERVPFRRVPIIPGCGNLDLTLNTGVAAWKITSDPDTSTSEPRAASIVASNSIPSSWSPLPGAQWIGPNVTASGPPGDYHYSFTFCLCSGFSNARLTLIGLADNRATVFLNNNPLSPTITGFSGSGTNVSTTGSFQAGTNVVRVVVSNDGGPTGLNLRGSITATAGRCLTLASEETNPELNPN